MLSDEQIATLKTFVASSTIPAIITARQSGATIDLAKALNADASPAVKVWRFVPKGDIFRVWDPSELDSITTASKRDTMWGLLTNQGGLDCGTAIGPKLITDLFPQGSAPNDRAAILGIAWENASVAENVLGGNTVASVAPPTSISAIVRNWTGDVSQSEAQKILAA